MKEIQFDQQCWHQARGRNGFLNCHGVAVSDMSARAHLSDNHAEIHLNPITSKGLASESCRIPIRKSAIPELIAALHAIWMETAA